MTFVRLAGALLATGCFMFVLASVGVQQARSSSGCDGTPGFNLELGIANTCNRPTTLSGSSSGIAVSSSLAGGTALFGDASASTGDSTGVYGTTDSSGAHATGVFGELSSRAPGSPSAAVVGESASTTANGYGVWGLHIQNSGAAPAVLGQTDSTAANAAGVLGTIFSSSPGSGSAAVRGINNGTGVFGVGVWGSHAGSGWGVYGSSPAGKGVVGQSTTGLAGYFAGDVQVTGTLTKGAGAFKIDHPLDPAHSYLQHSFVESPDMKNIYDGVVATERQGLRHGDAARLLSGPEQGLPLPADHPRTRLLGAQARVWDEIAHNRFTIRTNKPGIKVSWQVTGIRHDRYANAHRIQVVVPKQGSAEGRYLHPELYGKPLSKSVVVLPGMKPGTQPKFRTAAPPAHK